MRKQPLLVQLNYLIVTNNSKGGSVLWYIFGDALRSLDKATTTKQFLRAFARLENAVALFPLCGPNSIQNAVDTLMPWFDETYQSAWLLYDKVGCGILHIDLDSSPEIQAGTLERRRGRLAAGAVQVAASG